MRTINSKQSHIILEDIGIVQGRRSFHRVVKTASTGELYVNYCGGRYLVEKFKGLDGTVFNFYVGIKSVHQIQKRWGMDICHRITGT